jgi:predicted permease
MLTCMGEPRYAARSLRKSPGFAAIAVITLALGIGANTAIFSVLDAVLLRPLPYASPGRLVVVALYNRSLKYPTDLSYPDFLDWQRSSRSLEQIAAFAQQGYNIAHPGPPEHVDGRPVSSNFFETLGVRLALGSGFSAREDRAGGMPAAVISDRLWRERFASSRAAVGRTITLNGADYTVIGVLRPDFRFATAPADVYTPIGQWNPRYATDRTVHDVLCIARLGAGVGIETARAEMNTVQQHIDDLNPSTERGLGIYLKPWEIFLTGDTPRTILLLAGAVGLVLLIACANVANLTLARSAARRREFAVRLALGASRARIARQSVTESVLLSLAGGAAGVALAEWGVKLALAAAPGTIAPANPPGVDGPVLAFALGISLVVGIVFGMVPALNSARTDPRSGLKDGGRGSTGAAGRTQRALAALEVALALVLLTGGSLLFRSVHNLWAVNPGFDARRVITFQVGPSPAAATTPAKIKIELQELVDRVRAIPGIDDADFTALMPLGQGANEGPFWTGSRQPASMTEIPRAIWYPVGPEYFRTMGIPVLSGRALSRADNLGSERVVVIDRLLARTYFPGQDAVGQSLTLPHWGNARNVTARIAGVVGHVEQYSLDGGRGEKPQIYYSFYQLPDEEVPGFRDDERLVARTTLDGAAAMAAIRRAVYEAGSGQPVYNVHSMEQIVEESMGRERFPMVLVGAFGALALALASVGVYGVFACAAAARSREFGIRMALGAMRGDVVVMVLGQGMRLALIGMAMGAAASLILNRVLTSFSQLLYGVSGNDPLTLGAASLVLAGAAAGACLVPALRASRVDPIDVLREE